MTTISIDKEKNIFTQAESFATKTVSSIKCHLKIIFMIPVSR